MSGSTVSAILLQHDILEEVLSHLIPTWDDGDREDLNWDSPDRELLRSTLAASALVCHTFSKYALNGLWRVLDDIGPLLRILPCASSRSYVRVYPDITDTTWSRFQCYAQRIRELKTIEPALLVHSSAWQILVRRLDGTPLLPKLRRLQTAIMLPRALPGILLLSPSLRWLQLSTPHDFNAPDGSDPETNMFVNNIVQHICLLSVPVNVRRTLHMALPEASSHLQSLGRFTSLQELDLEFTSVRVGYQTLQTLSSLESLRGLRAYVSLKEMDSTASFRDGFPALHALSLRGSAEDVLKLLQALSLDKLTELGLSTEKQMSVEDYKRFLASARFLISTGLISLILRPETFNRSNFALSLAEILEPMMSLPKLSNLYCEFRTYPKDVSDDDLHAFAIAWPRLVSFWAIYKDHIPGVQPITVAGLMNLLQRCPDLESVGLATLDIGHLPSPGSIPRLENRVWELAVYRFVGEAEADLLVFALIVDRLLPCLKVPRSIADRSRRTEWTDRLWDKVRLLVAPLQAARRISA